WPPRCGRPSTRSSTPSARSRRARTGSARTAAEPSRRPGWRPSPRLGSASTALSSAERRGRAGTRQQRTVVAVLAAVGVWALLRNGTLSRDSVVLFALLIPSVILHEVSPGAVALLLGDDP